MLNKHLISGQRNDEIVRPNASGFFASCVSSAALPAHGPAWGGRRGQWRHGPHRFANMSVDARGKRAIVHAACTADGAEPFEACLKELTITGNLALVTDCAYTVDLLRRSRVGHVIPNKGSVRSLELVVPEEFPPEAHADWDELFAATAALALQEAEGLSWL